MRYSSYDPSGPTPAIFYLPENQSVAMMQANDEDVQVGSHYLDNIVLWAPGHSIGLEAQVRHAIAEIDPNFTMDFASYSEVVRLAFAQQNLISKVTSLFGGLALLLAAVGVCGVTAYSVEQRTNEIGVRMALGANRRTVVSMLLRSVFIHLVAGLVIGIPATVGVGRAITSQLYQVKAYDPEVLAAAISLLLFAALVGHTYPGSESREH